MSVVNVHDFSEDNELPAMSLIPPVVIVAIICNMIRNTRGVTLNML